MITKIIMPKLGETMEEGILTKWLKQEGERVEKGEPLFEVTTDKATFEVESPVSGFLRKILIPADSEKPIPVTQTIGYIADTMDEEIPIEVVSREQVVVSKEEVKPIVPEKEVVIEVEERIKASPLAKKLAKEKGIDLSQVKGTGPGGRITEKDVLEAVRSKELVVSKDEVEVISLSPMRKAIAQRVTKSKHDIPHFYLQTEIEMTNAVKLREQLNKSFSYNDLIIKAVAKALEEFSLLNSIFEDDKLKIFKKVNIGILVSYGDKLLIPVIKDANKKSIQEITNETKEIKEKTKLNKFSPEDFSGGTFTISNLGMFDIDEFNAIINPPQVGILAFGKIKEVPGVKNGEIIVSWKMKVSISLDHRVIDGVYGANFLKRLKEILENPVSLVV